MATSRVEAVALAKQGDIKSIVALLNNKLRIKGIHIRVKLEDECLQVLLDFPEAPPTSEIASLVEEEVKAINSPAVKRIKIYGRKFGEKLPIWIKDFEVTDQYLVTDSKSQYLGDSQAKSLSSNSAPKPKASTIRSSEQGRKTKTPQSTTVSQSSSLIEIAKDRKVLIAGLFGGICLIAFSLVGGIKLFNAMGERAESRAMLAQASSDVIATFEEIDSRVEVGVNIREYVDLVSDAKFALEQYAKVDGASNEVLLNLESALKGHFLALDFWRCDLETNSILEGRCKDEAIYAIADKYPQIQAEIDNIQSREGTQYIHIYVGKGPLLSQVWKYTEADTQSASEQIRN